MWGIKLCSQGQGRISTCYAILSVSESNCLSQGCNFVSATSATLKGRARLLRLPCIPRKEATVLMAACCWSFFFFFFLDTLICFHLCLHMKAQWCGVQRTTPGLAPTFYLVFKVESFLFETMLNTPGYLAYMLPGDAPELLPSITPRECWNYRQGSQHPAFTWALGIRTQDIRLIQKAH